MRGAYALYGLGLLILILGTVYAFNHSSKQSNACTSDSATCREAGEA